MLCDFYIICVGSSIFKIHSIYNQHLVNILQNSIYLGCVKTIKLYITQGKPNI